MVARGILDRLTWPPVTAAATTNVPASIRSGRTRCSPPRRRLRPMTSIVSGAVRWISAPIVRRNAIRSSTSGSSAAGWIVVRPSARTAASIAFSVPMTDTKGNCRSVPRRRPGERAK